MVEDDTMTVEVVYATPARQELIEVRVPSGTTIERAIVASGILSRFPEIDLGNASVGVFGKVAGLGTQLSNGDRVEIYRPLEIDPKQARRQRASKGVRT